MDFVAIDFETANSDRNSICSMGLAVIKNNQIIDKKYRLIQPPDLYFDPYNIEIHGITEDMVKNEPKFNELWSEILPLLEGKIVVAHYASFDLSVLRHTLSTYEIAFPKLNYACSWIIGKKTWQGLINYKLNALANHLDISFKHHNALEDACACAEIVIKAGKQLNCNSMQELSTKLDFLIGTLYEESYIACSLNKSCDSKRFKEITATTTDFDEHNYFHGKNIAFTGTLLSMPRKDAVQKIVDAGGIFANTLNIKTNILVYGYQDISRLAENENKSSKFRKAELLLSKGADIELLCEDDFMKLLSEDEIVNFAEVCK